MKTDFSLQKKKILHETNQKKNYQLKGVTFLSFPQQDFKHPVPQATEIPLFLSVSYFIASQPFHSCLTCIPFTIINSSIVLSLVLTHRLFQGSSKSSVPGGKTLA